MAKLAFSRIQCQPVANSTFILSNPGGGGGGLESRGRCLTLRPIYTVRLCSIRQAYDRPTT